jgi:quercetin dioxygenase-like cupin family protein
MDPKSARAADITAIPIAAGSSRKTITWGDRTLVSEVTFEQGGVVPMHSHPHEQTGYVVSGAIEFTLGERTIVLRSGDGYLIPGHVPHGCLAIEPSVAVDVFSPVREEYK